MECIVVILITAGAIFCIWKFGYREKTVNIPIKTRIENVIKAATDRGRFHQYLYGDEY